MTTRPQPEPHLDTDQLTAFAEGALPASERALCLRHLAECAHCREIAFLAGASLPFEEPAPIPERRFHFAWRSALSLSAAAIAAAVIAIVLLHHAHQRTRPATVQVATESPVVPPTLPTIATPPSRANPAEPSMQSAPKPSPALKAPSRPIVPILDDRQVKDATALDSATALKQSAVGASQQQAATGKTLQGVPTVAAAPPAQLSHAQIPAVAKAAPAYTLPAYDKLELRTPDGSSKIAGTITDSSGAALGHANVTLDQASGGAHHETLTDANGRFTISSLQAGKYRLEIFSPGFVEQVREVDLGASQLARVDSQLAVGSAAETVTVPPGGSALNTESASVQSVLPGKEPLQTSVSSGSRTLVLNSLGKLFLSKNAGTHWKALHGPWKKSAVTNLSFTPDQNFKVTTSKGSWLSTDGEHWHPAN